MPKQIVLHYAGSYVERPHTITFDSEREYEKFIQEKGYRLKPNVEYGVFTLNSILRTQFQQSSIKIEDVSEADKPDISTVTPPTIDIKYPQCGCTQDKEEDNNQGNNQEGTDTLPKDEEGNDTPPVVTPPVEIVITSPKVNVDRLVEEKAKNNLNSVNVEFDKVGNVITITGDINDLQEYPSSVAIQGSGKWIPLEVGTGLPTIVGVKFDEAELTEADRQEALGLGMAEGSFVLWIKATEDYDRDITIEKDGVIKTIKIKFNNTPKETPTPAPDESGDDEVIVIGGEDENQDTPTQDSNPTTPPTDNQGEDVVVIGGDDDTQNPTQDPDTTDTTTSTTDTTDETQDENQGADEGFNRVGPVVSFGPEVTGNDGEESQTENTQDGDDSEIIIPDEGSSENTSPTPGDEDIIVL